MYLCGDGYQAAIHTVVNALAIVSGIVCDGAKASCAAKIASSVDAALLGYNMYKCNQEFKGGDGIVMKDIETPSRASDVWARTGCGRPMRRSSGWPSRLPRRKPVTRRSYSTATWHGWRNRAWTISSCPLSTP